MQFNATAATELLNEYNSLKALSELGFELDIEELESFDAAVYLCIYNERARLENEEMKKMTKKTKAPKGRV